MIARLHFSMTLLFSYILFYFLFESHIIALILSFIVASLCSVPDYDWKIYSWANRKYTIFQKKKLLKFILFPYYLFILFLIKIFRHRTTTHSLLIVIAIYLLAKIINMIIITKFLIFLSLAMFFHIIEDCFTVSGVPLFYPLSKKSYKIPLINTKQDVKKQLILEKICYIALVTLFLLL